MWKSRALAAAGVALFAACSADESNAPPADAQADGGAPAVQCEKPTTGPTEHDSAIEADETWTAAASPHVLTWDVYVSQGATLTIEPCAEVLLGEGSARELLATASRSTPRCTTAAFRTDSTAASTWR